MAAVDYFGQIPAAINHVRNPSFVSGYTYWAANQGTLTYDAPVVWSGSTAGKLTISGVATQPYIVSISSTTLGIVCAPGDEVNAAFRVYAPTVVNRACRIQTTYRNSAGSALLNTWSPWHIVPNDGYFEIQHTTAGPAPVGTVYAIVLLIFSIAPVATVEGITGVTVQVGDVFYIDAAEARVNQPLDVYGDGNHDGWVWEGTANQSRSIRAATDPVGLVYIAGGITTVDTTVYQSDALGNLYDDLTPWVIGGEISHDVDRDFAGTCSLQVTDPTLFQPFSWVRVFQTVQHEGHAEPHDYSVGLFRLTQPSATWLDGIGEVAGIDPTIQIHDTNVTALYNVPGGIQYTDAVATLLDAAGFAGRYSIPEYATLTPAEGLTFSRGTSYLDIINTLLNAIGYYRLYAMPDGTLASLPYLDRFAVEPSHTWVIGQDAELIGEVVEQVNDDNLYNYVVATRVRPDQTVDVRVSENKRVSHPYSTVSLGKLAGLPKVYRTKRIEFNDAADTVALQQKASHTLKLASMLRYVTVQVLPHPDHIPHEIVELIFDGTAAEQLTGRYYVDSSIFGLVGADSTMTVRMRRIEGTE